VPVYLRVPFYGLFSRMYGVKMHEATKSYRDYATFTDFFTRNLKPGVRKIHREDDKYSLCSPCDGTVLTTGLINNDDSTIDCVKGRSYRLDEFMLGVIGDDGAQDSASRVKKIGMNHSQVQGLLEDVEQRGNDLHYMVIYLSPGDYHRFHSPAIHTARYRRHIVGYLEPVKPAYVKKHKDVFKQNERVNIFGEWYGSQQNFFFLSYVGALNVGSIKLDFDTEVVTNMTRNCEPYYYDLAYTKRKMTGPLSDYAELGAPFTPKPDGDGMREFKKGEMTGRFEMGSTIVLMWESPKNTMVHVVEGQKVSLGQKIVTTGR